LCLLFVAYVFVILFPYCQHCNTDMPEQFGKIANPAETIDTSTAQLVLPVWPMYVLGWVFEHQCCIFSKKRASRNF